MRSQSVDTRERQRADPFAAFEKLEQRQNSEDASKLEKSAFMENFTQKKVIVYKYEFISRKNNSYLELF